VLIRSVPDEHLLGGVGSKSFCCDSWYGRYLFDFDDLAALLPVAEGVPCCCARPWAFLPLSYQASLLFAWNVFWVASI